MAKNQPESCPPRVMLEDGTELRLVPLERTGRPLYVSAKGQVYSYRRKIFRPLKPKYDTSPRNKYNGHRKQRYLKLSGGYSFIYIHHAVALAWIGPRPEGYECDHLNGITTDNRLENLEWVTPEENMRRAQELRKQRKAMANKLTNNN